MLRAAAVITVKGRVQGVGYRYFAERLAAEHSITGWVMNMPDSSVALDVEGGREDLERFIEGLKAGPSMSRVSGVTVSWKPFQGLHRDFFIKY